MPLYRPSWWHGAHPEQRKGGLDIRPPPWLPRNVFEIAKTLIGCFIPAVALGVTMTPWWWWGLSVAGVALGLGLWRRSTLGASKKWLLVASAALPLAAAFFVCACWSASDSCNRPPADGLCIFSGFPHLAAFAIWLLLGVVALVQAFRLRNAG